jgi:hypothetical protein
MVTFQIQAVTVIEPATGSDDLKMETLSQNKVHTETGKDLRLLV